MGGCRSNDDAGTDCPDNYYASAVSVAFTPGRYYFIVAGSLYADDTPFEMQLSASTQQGV